MLQLQNTQQDGCVWQQQSHVQIGVVFAGVRTGAHRVVEALPQLCVIGAWHLRHACTSITCINPSAHGKTLLD